ncbi:hypothetical protein [Aequorivita xiaoshiensis]|uniref:Lipid A 3-O-deacylase (PagL) n=1 Tax=Aequorivita xiaoshiensis TaxID=2874476 RepID=A0A9X1R4Q0_9FLAO|nr:hypothetical protein [Aequorivita xiaoshiensis]MCG2431692.1 hypothetical protein [Aequorivita xiaoshiensis]
MKLVNIKFLSIAAFLLIGITATAQKGDRQYNNWSIEAQTGYHVPLAPNKFVELGDYDGAFKQFQAGVRYMITEKYGVRAHYSFLNFENPEVQGGGVKYNRVAIEGVANVWKVANVEGEFKENIGLLFHLGAGVTFANPSTVTGTDHIGNIIVGFTPQFRITDNIALFADFSYMANIKQHYSYGGELFDLGYKHETGGLVNLSVGVSVSFGNREEHADWYYDN